MIGIERDRREATRDSRISGNMQQPGVRVGGSSRNSQSSRKREPTGLNVGKLS